MAWICLGLLDTWVSAANLPGDNSGWVSRVWQMDDGLPGNDITGVAQTGDGYLWLSTHRGFIRFDGVSFQNIPLPEFPKGTYPLIRGMTMSADEQIWMALEGNLAVRFKRGGSNEFTSVRGLSNYRPLAPVVTHDGTVWIGYSDGSACRIKDGKVKQFAAQQGLAGVGFCCLACDAADQLWFSKAGHVGVFRNEEFIAELTLPERVVQIAPAKSGGIWVCSGSQLFKYKKGESLVKLGGFPPGSQSIEPSVLLEDRSGALWIGTTTAGLFRYDGTRIFRIETSHQSVVSLTEDREDSVWVGTAGGGLNRLRPRVLELENRDSGLPFETVRSVCEDDSGLLWATGENGVLARHEPEGWKIVTTNAGWPGAPATCIASDAQGTVWIGTYLGGLCSYENGVFTSIKRKDGLGSDIVRSLLMDSKGDMWIGLESPASVQKWHQGQFQKYALPKDNPIRAMAEDSSGTIWMAASDGRLLRVYGDVLTNEAACVVSPPRPVRCLFATADGSLWVGYAGAGVGRFKAGHFTTIGTEQGLFDDYICSIAGDGAGIWFGSERGIFQVRQAELDAVAEHQAERVLSMAYGRDQVLPNLEANYGYVPSAIRSRDGRLYFPMRTGLAVAHPDRVQFNQIPPPVLVENMTVDGREVDLKQTNGNLSLPPGHRNVEIKFTALSFVSPENVYFRHRLEGWDEGWQEESPRRSVSYSRLPAGDYTFRVMACNDARVWSKPEVLLRFKVEPFIWQTWWFILFAAVATFALIAAGVSERERRRHRRELDQLERQRLMERERTRVARDLHDDLGAGLTEIGLIGSLAQRHSVLPERTQQHLEQITLKAREMVTSLDEIVWAINPKHDSVASLGNYLCEYAQHFLELTTIRCRMEISRDLPVCSLNSEKRHSLFLAFKEALTNVVRHSQATEARIIISAHEGNLYVTVEDNGQGVPVELADAGADGMNNMSRRLEQIGGRCEVKSTPKVGTSVQFTFPLTEGRKS